MPSVSTPPYLDLPAGARPLSLQTSRGELAGLRIEAAAPEQGTAVLVPGWTGSKEDFIAVLAPLAWRGWSVVAYDQRGQFESPGPEDESAYSLASLARDLLEVVEPIGPAHVVGHSFGGLVAREAALTSGGQGFASLTLLCSGPGPLPAGHHDGLGALHAALPHVPLETIWTVKEAADREGGWRPPTDEVAAFMHRRFVANNAYALRAKTALLLDTPDRTDELAALAAGGFPVGVVYGPDDDAWPTSAQDRVAVAVGTTACVIDGAGHSPAAERPERTAQVLDALWRGFAAGHQG